LKKENNESVHNINIRDPTAWLTADMPDTSIVEQAKYLLDHPRIYSSEYIAREFLTGTLLSYNQHSNHANHANHERQVLQAVQTVLQSHHCASAIMAPSVDDENKETPNPVRKILFHTLQARLVNVKSIEMETILCDCLTEAIQCAQRVEGAQALARATDMEISLLQSYFLNAFGRGDDGLRSALSLRKYLG